jgi:flagellin
MNTYRAIAGAQQNILEHSMINLSNYSVNISSAKSRISDLNVARQAMEYTKQQIILESSEAMVAQANNLSQNVLHLLKQTFL